MPTTRLTTIREFCAKRKYTGTAVQHWLSQRLSNLDFRRKYHVNRIKDGHYWMYDSSTLNRLVDLYDAKAFTLKTVVIYVIQGKYQTPGQWEDEATYEKRSDAYRDLSEYCEAGRCHGSSYRVIKRRIPNPDHNPNYA